MLKSKNKEHIKLNINHEESRRYDYLWSSVDSFPSNHHPQNPDKVNSEEHFLVFKSLMRSILEYDQLTREKLRGNAFQGFSEGKKYSVVILFDDPK